MASGLLTEDFETQNFYTAYLTADITDTDTDIFLDIVPNGTEGTLIIEPDSDTNREIVFYNSKSSTKVTTPANGRGYDGTNATAHLTGSKVIIAPIADWFASIQSGGLIGVGAITPIKLSGSVLINRGIDTKTTLNTIMTTSFVTYATVTATTLGGNVIISFATNLRDSGSGATRTGSVRVQQDGVTVSGSLVTYYTPNGLKDSVALQINSTATAASHTWTLQVQADTGSATYGNQMSLKVDEVIA